MLNQSRVHLWAPLWFEKYLEGVGIPAMKIIPSLKIKLQFLHTKSSNGLSSQNGNLKNHALILSRDDVIKWKHFLRYWPFVWGIHRSPLNSPHKGQWRGALMFSLISALNKRLSKQLWGWWFETPSRSLWRHCNYFWTFTMHFCTSVFALWISIYRLQLLKSISKHIDIYHLNILSPIYGILC